MSTIKVLVISLVLGMAMPAKIYAADQSTNKLIIDTACEMLIEGAKVGMDEAGGRLLGPTGWKAFKSVITPVVKRLQAKYPALNFGKRGDEKVEKAALAAANELKENKELQKMLTHNFDKLKDGQTIIVERLKKLEKVLYAQGLQHEDMIANIIELREDLKQKKDTKLPSYIDMSDEIESIELITRIIERNNNWDNNSRNFIYKAFLPLFIGRLFVFKIIDGEQLKTYSSNIYGKKYLAIPTNTFINDDDELCRAIYSVRPSPVNDKVIYGTHTFCVVNNQWVEVNFSEGKGSN